MELLEFIGFVVLVGLALMMTLTGSEFAWIKSKWSPVGKLVASLGLVLVLIFLLQRVLGMGLGHRLFMPIVLSLLAAVGVYALMSVGNIHKSKFLRGLLMVVFWVGIGALWVTVLAPVDIKAPKLDWFTTSTSTVAPATTTRPATSPTHTHDTASSAKKACLNGTFPDKAWCREQGY